MKIKIAFNRMRFIHKPGKDLNWEQFNQNFKNVELDVMEICNAIYRGHAYTAWMNGKRNKENFICAQHVAVDMDTQNYLSSLDALSEHPLVREYGAILHTTPTHSAQAPKARCIFLLDEPIDTLAGYELAQETIYSLFDGADTACVDGARFFFGNGKLRENHTPEGIWFSEKICFPLKDLRLFAQQYRQNARHDETEKRQAPPRPATGEQMSLDDIEQKLLGIDAYTLSYDWWIKTVAGLKHEFGDAAFWVAKRWSDRPGKEELTERKWQSLGNHTNPATIATVYRVIKEYGTT